MMNKHVLVYYYLYHLPGQGHVCTAIDIVSFILHSLPIARTTHVRHKGISPPGYNVLAGEIRLVIERSCNDLYNDARCYVYKITFNITIALTFKKKLDLSYLIAS